MTEAFSSYEAVIDYVFPLFWSGLCGMTIMRTNFLVSMLSAEVMYLGLITSFLLTGLLKIDICANIYSLLLLIVAASESAVGLGILIVLYRFQKSIAFSDYNELQN